MPTQTNLLNSDNSLLLIVDIQSRLLSVMPEEAAKGMVENSANLILAANLLDIPVLLTEQYPKGLGQTAEEISQQLNTSATVFEKTGFSCCSAENFNNTLQKTQRQQIIIVGQEAHVCVLQTALELIQQGFQVHIIEDAICSRKAEHKFFALQRLQQQGATISNFESVLFEWLRDSTHQHFKEISNLLF